jgi:hypothetical protein
MGLGEIVLFIFVFVFNRRPSSHRGKKILYFSVLTEFFLAEFYRKISGNTEFFLYFLVRDGKKNPVEAV